MAGHVITRALRWLAGASMAASAILCFAACGPFGSPPNLYAVAMLSSSEGWAAGPGGGIYHYRGGQWTGLSEPSNLDINALAMVSPAEGWAVGLVRPPDNNLANAPAVILHDVDGRWTIVQRLSPDVHLLGIAFASAGQGWAVGGDAAGRMILDYRDGTWSRDGSVPAGQSGDWLNAVAALPGGRAWVVGRGGAILRLDTTAPQPRWVADRSDAGSAELTGIAMVSPTEGWAVGGAPDHFLGGGIILHGTGTTWTTVKRLAHQTLSGVAMASATEGWAVGPSGTLLHGRDGGWSPVSGDQNYDLRGISMVSPAEGWAVGTGHDLSPGGVILHYVGGAWTQS